MLRRRTNRTVLARSARLELTEPGRGDAAVLAAAVGRSPTLHHPWVFPPATEVAAELWVERVRGGDVEAHLAWSGGDLVAVVNVNNIVLGGLQSGSLGYYGFAGHTGQGFVAEAVGAVVRRSFNDLGLHRLEANIQPANLRSRRVAERLGFRLEGYSPRYLLIDGEWRDHERWAITVEDVADDVGQERQ